MSKLSETTDCIEVARTLSRRSAAVCASLSARIKEYRTDILNVFSTSGKRTYR